MKKHGVDNYPSIFQKLVSIPSIMNYFCHGCGTIRKKYAILTFACILELKFHVHLSLKVMGS